MRICPKCGTPMEYEELEENKVQYVCPVCGYKEVVKEKIEVAGITIKSEKKGEGVIEEKKRKVYLSEEDIESVLEILESSSEF